MASYADSRSEAQYSPRIPSQAVYYTALFSREDRAVFIVISIMSFKGKENEFTPLEHYFSWRTRLEIVISADSATAVLVRKKEFSGHLYWGTTTQNFTVD